MGSDAGARSAFVKTAIQTIFLGLLVSGPIQADASDADVFKARRDALMEKLDGGVAVLYGANGSSAIVSGSFVQESSFYYLTGISEPGAALILAPGERRYQETLYLQPRNPEVENWDGRRVKDDQEIERIQKAINITGSGILAAMKAVEPGQMEFQLQSVVEHAYEMEGAQFLGFSTILAWGPNTTVLHYGSNNQQIQEAGRKLL